MRKILYFLAFLPLILLTGCDDCENDYDCDHNHNNNNYIYQRDPVNKVLIMRLDLVTHNLEGAIELTYGNQIDDFTIDIERDTLQNYQAERLIYRELNETLFYGTILLTGLGEMTFPEVLNPPASYDTVTTDDVVYPINGLDHIPLEQILPHTYYKLWLKVQKYEIVRQYLKSNPNQKVKLYIYNPTNGFNDSSRMDWFIFIKN